MCVGAGEPFFLKIHFCVVCMCVDACAHAGSCLRRLEVGIGPLELGLQAATSCPS